MITQQTIQIIVLIGTLINSTLIGYLITRNNTNIAIILGLIQSLIVGGTIFLN